MHPVRRSYGFFTWSEEAGRRICTLATFGTQEPGIFEGKMACVEPPRADSEVLTNASELRDAVVLVVRGGCSFAEKARRVQAVGAKAMILANNTHEDPLASFTMGETREHEAAAIKIPCLMMCLYDVRELLRYIPHSVKDATVKVELFTTEVSDKIAAECLRRREIGIHLNKSTQETNREGHSALGALIKKTSSLVKSTQSTVENDRRDGVNSTTAISTSNKGVSRVTTKSTSDSSTSALTPEIRKEESKPKTPLFAFIQWSNDGESYNMFYAPLSDFCVVESGAIYQSKPVICDPLLAHEEVIRNGSQLTGNIALVKRGVCTFPAKLERIQRYGALAAIVGNDDEHDPSAAFVMSVDHIKVDHITLPSVMVSFQVFEDILKNKPSSIRIICLSAESAAVFMACNQNSRCLSDIPDIGRSDCMGTSAVSIPRLHEICRRGDFNACQGMLNLVIDPKAREALVRANDGYMSNSLHHACIGGNANIVSLLLKNGAQMNTVDVGIQTPLHYACMYGHMNCVQVLLQAGISAASTAAGTAFINTTNIGGRTPLHYACSSGSAKCVELLLTMNAHMAEGGKYVFEGLNLQDNDGATPLHLACRKVHADCALYLIAANASLDIVDMKGESPLLIVCEKINEPKHSFAALHVVEKLMSAGADVQEKTELNEERKLVIDRIHSKNLRRELEILYLRQEVQRSRKKNDILSNELLQAQEHLKHLHQSQIQLKQFLEKQKLLYEQTSSDLHQKQSEIEQLQCQVKNILQFLQAVPIGTIPQVPANVSPINGLTNFAIPGVYSNEISEEEKAQEAALARDIAKKHYRNKKYAIAESYFEKSLEIFPLPGVYRMLVQTRQQRLEIDKLLEVERQQQQHLQTKETLMNEFRKAMANCKAPPHAIQSIENELQKMEHLEQDSAQFSMAQKWLEWLLSLPWETSTYFTKDSAGFHMEVFTKIEEIERENARAKESVAARVIQNAFREHFAVHLMNREKAAALVQAAWRGYRVRGQWEEITQKQIGLRFLARKEKETSAQVFTKEVIYKKAECSLKDSICKEPVKPVNYETDIDPKALSRLAAREKTSSIKQDIAESMITLGRAAHLIDGSLSSFHITQLIELQPLNQYYIWYRWGKDTSQQCESVLRGPYEEPEVAENEYEKSLKGKIAQGYFSIKELSCNSMSESLKLENAKMFAGHLHCPTITS